jgi:hypothetical protein
VTAAGAAGGPLLNAWRRRRRRRTLAKREKWRSLPLIGGIREEEG